MTLPAPLQAAESDYTVQGIQVDVTADNALAARDKAFSQAQIEAYQALAKRLAPDLAVNTPEPAEISTLVQDFEITQEKLSAVRYVATYTFRFKPDAVERFFAHSAAPSNSALVSAAPAPQPASSQDTNNILSSLFERVKQPARKILVIPYYRTGQASALWSNPNPWRDILSQTPKKARVDVMTPIGDLQDLRDLPGNDQASVGESGLMALQNRYGADEILLSSAQMMPNGALMVDLYAANQSQRGQIVLTRKMGQTERDLLQEAALQLQDYLASDTDTTPTAMPAQVDPMPTSAPAYAPVPAPGSVITAIVRFSSLEEWARVQQRLNRIPMLTDRTILALSTGQALISLPVQGPFENLQMALNSAGMDLRPGMPGDPAYTLALLP
ncbi:MAG: DUF2066 domain-containing protein [Alphaproteobacteria bacterium]|nr:DUF2066 domain-containing protein [Alphaproteobacteria bacterium]